MPQADDKTLRKVGRKPLPYRTVVYRVPEPILDDVAELIADFKRQSLEDSTNGDLQSKD